MNTKLHFSSEKQDWATPWDLFNKYTEIYKFDLDVCAQPHNTKCEKFFTPEQDGLKQDWNGHKCWCNPPYGRQISKWVEKAWATLYEVNVKEKTLVCCLLPARTDTKWFHRWIYKCPFAEVEFLKGRIKFEGAEHAAPFPSMIVIWS